jgi:hypothetical protein
LIYLHHREKRTDYFFAGTIIVGQASRLSPASKKHSTVRCAITDANCHRKQKIKKSETGATPVLLRRRGSVKTTTASLTFGNEHLNLVAVQRYIS